jgi:hypothetical protein
MVQTRVYNFGDLLTQARAKLLAQSLFSPGIYEGFAPTITGTTGTQITFAAGTYLLPNGVLIKEDDVTAVTVPTPASATDYTITVDHDDIQAVGGSSVYYTLRTGILGRSADPNPNSLALLWIRHSGAGPLTDDMLSRPPTLQAGSLLSAIEDGFLAAPFPQLCDVVQGSNITATQASHSSGSEVLGLSIVNSAASGTQTYQFRLPLPPRPVPRQIEVYADLPALGTISFDTAGYELYDADGNAVAVTPSTVSGAVTALDPRAAPAGTFDLANYDETAPPVSLGVTVVVPASTPGVFIRGFNLIGD